LSWSFHNFFQEFGFKWDKAEINLGELIKLKADLEEKFPFGEGDQRNVDGWGRPTLIFKISLMLVGSKRESKRGVFQEESGFKRSRMVREGLDR
jgi:hypothetical protein